MRSLLISEPLVERRALIGVLSLTTNGNPSRAPNLSSGSLYFASANLALLSASSKYFHWLIVSHLLNSRYYCFNKLSGKRARPNSSKRLWLICRVGHSFANAFFLIIPARHECLNLANALCIRAPVWKIYLLWSPPLQLHPST